MLIFIHVVDAKLPSYFISCWINQYSQTHQNYVQVISYEHVFEEKIKHAFNLNLLHIYDDNFQKPDVSFRAYDEDFQKP